MSSPTDVHPLPGNGLTQLVRVLEGQAGDRGVRELLEGVHAALLARQEEQTAFRDQQAKLQAELEGARRTVTEQQTLIESLQKERARLTVERDQHLRCLYFYVKKEMMVTEEEIA